MIKLVDRLVWAGKRIKDAAVAFRSAALGLGGLGLIDGAVWMNSLTWGMVSTGASLLLLQWLAEGSRR